MNSRNRNFIWVPLIFLALGSGLNAQKSANSGSNVPALPADIPGSAMRYSVLESAPECESAMVANAHPSATRKFTSEHKTMAAITDGTSGA